MYKLNFASYVKAIKKGMTKPTNKKVVALLLEFITNKEYVLDDNGNPYDFNDTRVNAWTSQREDIPQIIKKTADSQEILPEATDHFEGKVLTSLSNHKQDDAYSALIDLIETDKEIPLEVNHRLVLLKENNDLGEFLRDTFLYAIQKDNIDPVKVKKKKSSKKKKDDDAQISFDNLPKNTDSQLYICEKSINEATLSDTNETSSTYLLMEVNGTCPLCGSSLVTDKNGNSVHRYFVVDIYPQIKSVIESEAWKVVNKPCEDLSSTFNQTVLCPRCAIEYMSYTSVEEYEKLLNTKQILSRNYIARNKISNIELEEQIEIVLRRISKAGKSELSEQLNYDALHITNKIESDNIPLIMKIQCFVVNYYNYIRSLFLQLEDEGILYSEDISLAVNHAYKKLLRQKLNQDEIFAQLVNWVKNKTMSSNDIVCEIIVSFFVQECEVFHEITK